MRMEENIEPVEQIPLSDDELSKDSEDSIE